jgi:hypothetical protein
MKKKYGTLVATLLSIFLLAGCKKSSSPDNNTSRDYASSVINKTWWGTLADKDQSDEYYSVHFNTDNTLVWEQLSGTYNGFWALEGRQLTITFEVNDVKITADIGDDNKLSHFSDNTDFSEIKTGQLINIPDIPLENTIWEGTEKNKSLSYLVRFEFDAKKQMTTTFNGLPHVITSYSRSSSGDVVRSLIEGANIFLVIVSDHEMKGLANTVDVTLNIAKK